MGGYGFPSQQYGCEGWWLCYDERKSGLGESGSLPSGALSDTLPERSTLTWPQGDRRWTLPVTLPGVSGLHAGEELGRLGSDLRATGMLSSQDAYTCQARMMGPVRSS